MDNRFENWEFPEIKEGELTKYNWMVYHKDNLELGKKTDIGAFSFINAKHGVVIEDEVQIGGGVKIYSESTIDNKQGKVILKKNCKIGANSVILPGVTIGENSIIGAFSLVNQDIPANAVAYGIPAKVKRSI